MIRPIDRSGLVELLLNRVGDRRRVVVDGPPPTEPEVIAQSLVDSLQAGGRPAIHVRSNDFLRPASIRFEFGRTNPDSYYERWVDLAALNREVLTRRGSVLPTFWNPLTDRATRAAYLELAPEGVVVLSGDLLLGAGLELDFTVHLEMSPAAFARRTDPALAWTLPAYARYAEEVGPASFADVVVRMNDPHHPALVVT
ncbi:MAG TPA: uridine kinase [Micromonosporaceae bacterium]|nr:uridine kinase [Micromonosporaceae bacterium]